MADVGDNNFMRYVYRGEEGEEIPDGATHITVAEGVTFVRAQAFKAHLFIVEIICHDRVEKIEEEAFSGCLNLRRVIMPGVKIVELYAFCACLALTDVECGKLEIIGEAAFWGCEYLRSINLPTVRIVERDAFFYAAVTDVKFGSKLERIEGRAFERCTSLRRITIPLKDGLIGNDDDDNIFQLCENLRHVDLVEGELHETIAALQLEDWRHDMNEEIDSINQTLRYIPAGIGVFDPEENDLAIRMWIRSVLRKITRYQSEHQLVLNEAAATLQFALPQDIVTKSVLPFLELPSYTFEREEEDGEEEDY